MDFDEHIDPLDPRFVDAVLARARRRAAGEEAAAAATPSAPAAPSVPPSAAPLPDATPAGAQDEHVPQDATAPSITARANGARAADRVVADDPTAAAPVVPAPSVFADEPATSEPAPGEPTASVATVDAIDPDELDPEEDDGKEGRRTRNLVEWIAVAVGAVVVAFLIRAFLLQAFYIPSESMEPTLYENDRILVNKLSYKLHDVNRGDLVVFEKPSNEPENGIKDLIKRTIALPNETIELQPDGTITIDGRALNEPYLADGQQPGQMTMARTNYVDGACTNPPEETTRCTVGDGFVFVMGDNRDHSHDSRAFGPIDEDLIVGRAFVKVWPLSEFGFL